MDTGPVEGADAPSLAATRAGSRVVIVATTGGGGLNDVCVAGVEPDCGDGGCTGPVSEVQAEAPRRAVGHTHRELHPGVPFRVLVDHLSRTCCSAGVSRSGSGRGSCDKSNCRVSSKCFHASAHSSSVTEFAVSQAVALSVIEAVRRCPVGLA